MTDTTEHCNAALRAALPNERRREEPPSVDAVDPVGERVTDRPRA